MNHQGVPGPEHFRFLSVFAVGLLPILLQAPSGVSRYGESLQQQMWPVALAQIAQLIVLDVRDRRPRAHCVFLTSYNSGKGIEQ
jgi:hypothetical protein